NRRSLMLSSPRSSRLASRIPHPNPASPLANDFPRFLVIAQSLKRRVTQQPVICPFGEAGLGDQLRFEPAKFSHFIDRDPFAEMTFPARREIGEWTLVGQ